MDKEIGKVSNTIDRVVSDPEAAGQLKGELHEVQSAVKAQQNTVDGWLTRYIRPCAVIFTMLMAGASVVQELRGVAMPQHMSEGLITLALVVFTVYAGGKSVEKGAGKWGQGRR